MERPREVSAAHVRPLCERLDREVIGQVFGDPALEVVQRLMISCLHLERRAELRRLTLRSVDKHDEVVGDLQAEESAAADIRPRLEHFGADTTKVHFLKSVLRESSGESSFNLATDMEALESAVDQLGDVKLILVDPVASFCHGISGHNDGEVRKLLNPLFALAERNDIAVVLVAHLNKDGEKDFIYRIGGSIAFVALSRMVWYLSVDPYDPDRRLLSFVKGNPVDKITTGLAFGYVSRKMAWCSEPVELNAQQADNILQAQKRKTALLPKSGPAATATVKAGEFLLSYLARGPALQSSAQDQALQQGIKESSFRKSVRLLCDDSKVDARIERYQEGKPKRWWLRLVPGQEEAVDQCTNVESPSIDEPNPVDVWEDDGGLPC